MSASLKPIRSALISVYHKTGLDTLVSKLHAQGVVFYSTGGTQEFLQSLGIPVHAVENLTGYPSILDGRVKTLHPKVFGGILARREEDHLSQLRTYDIPEIDLVLVDLYPFEQTVANTRDEKTIIEKIDIGGISLIRAAAKNYGDVVIVPSSDEYGLLESWIDEQGAATSLEQRRELATRAFGVSAHYDTAIFSYFNEVSGLPAFRVQQTGGSALRYGENPHQKATFYGDLSQVLEVLSGKELSYNNLVDVDAALQILEEFKQSPPTFAILKHNNPCGLATRSSAGEAWAAALAGDPVSAFGGIIISNTVVDLETAAAIDQLFYEVLAAPGFTGEALELLQKKKNRILLRLKDWHYPARSYRSLLNGTITQDTDLHKHATPDWKTATTAQPTAAQTEDLYFANKCVKHLKSNAIALVREGQLIGIGCGQTSRVDALRQALLKARSFGFETAGAVLASDAFFPFGDCVSIAHEAGVAAFVQPGGSVRDQESIDFCNEHGLPMVFTGVRHFKH